jgi:hypothetical protein
MRLAYFQTNRLYTGLYKTEPEIRWRKDDNKIKEQTDIDRHGPKPSSNSRQSPNPPSLFITHYLSGDQPARLHVRVDWHKNGIIGKPRSRF